MIPKVEKLDKFIREARHIEKSFDEWGIELGDDKLNRLMAKIRPDVYSSELLD
jgi:hypothetical protein